MLQVLCSWEIRSTHPQLSQFFIFVFSFYLWSYVLIFVSSLLHWSPVGPKSPQYTWNGWGVWRKCWGIYEFAMLFVPQRVPFFWLCKLMSCILFFFRLLERIIPWNLLRAGGHSVLSLMLVLLGLQPVTVCLVPLR